MSLLSRLVLILVTAAVATQPASNKAPAPRISMDKIPFPDVDNADWKTFDQLPLVGKMMGQVPEKAMDGRWISLSGETECASRLRSKLGDLKIGSVGTQFAASGGPANATDTLIGLTNGRITRVVLVFSSHLSWDDAERKLKDYSVQSVSAENGVNMYKYWGEIDRANMKYYGRVIGYWSQTIPATVKQTINGNGTVTKTAVPEQHMDGPTGIVVDIDAVSWAVSNFVRPEHVADVQKHHLAEGMTEPEARVAMFGKESRLVEQNGQTKIEFYQPPKRVRGPGQPTAVASSGQPRSAPADRHRCTSAVHAPVVEAAGAAVGRSTLAAAAKISSRATTQTHRTPTRKRPGRRMIMTATSPSPARDSHRRSTSTKTAGTSTPRPRSSHRRCLRMENSRNRRAHK